MNNNRLGTDNVREIIPIGFSCCLGCLSCVFSLILTWVGLAILSSASSNSLKGNKIIDCNRINPSRADCLIRKETLIEKKNIQIVQDIKRAEVVSSKVGGGYKSSSQFKFQLILISQTSTTYVFDSTISPFPNNNTEYVNLTTKINDFIKNPNEKVLKVETNSNSSSFLTFGVGIVLTIIGMSPWIILVIARRYGGNWFAPQR